MDDGAHGIRTDRSGAGALDIRCACGAVRGTLDPGRSINRVVCYCADCRAFARHCGGAALDASGGTDLYQTTSGQVRLEGRNALAAVRVTARGPVRWHCARCRTALANTLPSPALPFATLMVAALHGDRGVLPPVRGALFADAAAGPPLHPPTGVAGVVARFALAMPGARMRGEHRRSPFHEGRRPVAPVRVMEPDERAALAG